MSNAVDLAGKLNSTTAANIVKNGITHVGRYLSRTTWKGLDSVEVEAIKGAGLQIFSIYETDPTKASYFTTTQGLYDAQDAMNLAQQIGQPGGSAIYFTVDYDVADADLPAILAYFKSVRSKLSGFKLGAYGNFKVLNYLHANNAADYYFQTCAWSGGQRCTFSDIYQYQCDKQNWNGTGLNVDLDNLEDSDIGAWGQVINVGLGIVEMAAYSLLREQPSAYSQSKGDVQAGSKWIVNQVSADGNWLDIGGWVNIAQCKMVWSDVVIGGFHQFQIDDALTQVKKAFPNYHMEARKQ